MQGPYAEHVKAYARHLGYKLENHPSFLTVTELLSRREDLWLKAGLKVAR